MRTYGIETLILHSYVAWKFHRNNSYFKVHYHPYYLGLLVINSIHE